MIGFKRIKKEKARNVMEDIFQWDVASWSRSLKLWKPIADTNNRKTCLELGANQGGLSLWLALNGHYVICSDLENPEEKASQLHDNYRVDHLLEYEAINALNIPYENHFDIIIFKSMLGGIARDGQDQLRIEVMGQIHKALKKGGHLLFAENLAAGKLHQIARDKFSPWGKSWNYLKFEEVPSLLFPLFEHFKVKTTGHLAAFGRKEWHKRILAKLDVSYCNWMLSRKKHYIIYGWAQK